MRIWIMLICLAGILVCSACREAKAPESAPAATPPAAPASTPDATPTAGPPAAPAADEGFNVGNRAPEISGTDQDGKELKLSDYRGKVVLLDFWADW